MRMPRVLILEDEKVVARDLQTILGAIGYETSMAGSGEEALEVAERDQPDLALVDIHLAGTLDGIETAQRLRQRMDLAVVYLTAYADEQTLDRAKATEPCGYLVKPFDENTLRATLRMAVHKGGIERSN
jgi:CheY-like chemotaxis protein